MPCQELCIQIYKYYKSAAAASIISTALSIPSFSVLTVRSKFLTSPKEIEMDQFAFFYMITASCASTIC